MPQKAVTPQGKPVLAFLFENKFQIKDKYPQLICPTCKGKLSPRQGTNKSIRLHFFHANREYKCKSALLCHPESPEHETAKVLAYELLYPSLQRTNEDAFSLEFEYPIPDCGKHGRKADLAIVYRDKPDYVIECQLSPISQEALTERMQDYHEKELQQGWLLGGDANTDENRRAVYKYGDFLGFLNIKSQYSSIGDIGDSIFGI